LSKEFTRRPRVESAPETRSTGITPNLGWTLQGWNATSPLHNRQNPPHSPDSGYRLAQDRRKEWSGATPSLSPKGGAIYGRTLFDPTAITDRPPLKQEPVNRAGQGPYTKWAAGKAIIPLPTRSRAARAPQSPASPQKARSTLQDRALRPATFPRAPGSSTGPRIKTPPHRRHRVSAREALPRRRSDSQTGSRKRFPRSLR
jgi:hypothetical protein